MTVILTCRHTIEQGRWNSSNLANTPTERNRTITIQVCGFMTCIHVHPIYLNTCP